MKMVDDGKLKTTPAEEPQPSLTPEEQEDFLSYMESEGCTPSLSQAQKLKEARKESVLTSEKIQHIMTAKPPSVKPRDPQLMIPVAKVERYFPKGFTSDLDAAGYRKTAGKLCPRPPARQQMRGDTDDEIISC